MLDLLTRLAVVANSATTDLLYFMVAIVAAFVFFIAVTLIAALRAEDPEQRWLRYQILRDLLDLFRSRRSR